MSLNKVMLIGNVGRDPEVRYLEGNNPGGQGRKVATFTLATSERFRDRSGETRENTEWHNIVAWGQPADVCERFVRKGTQLYIEGRLRTRSWTDQTGNKRYTTEINVDTLQLLGRRDSDGSGYPSDQQGGYSRPENGSYQRQGGWQQPGQGAFQQPAQQGFQQPAYNPNPAPQPVQTAAPAAEDPTDDLPF